MRPRSKNKRWELVRVVTKSRLVDLAAMRAASKHDEVDELVPGGAGATAAGRRKT